LGAGGGQRRLDISTSKTAVGEDIVERVHHLGLCHHGQRRQIGRVDCRQVDVGEAAPVEG
jgi:hypothetical protein